MRSLVVLLAALTLASSASAQGSCPGNYTVASSTGTLRANRLLFPNTTPYLALQPASVSAWGYPQGTTVNWPAGVAIGDVNNDGQLDMVFQIEQRLLMAVTFTRNSCGVPIAVQPLWSIFDPAGDVNKSDWGGERPIIWDLDGDGLNEVAWVGHVQRNGQYDLEVQVIDNNPALTPDPAFNNELRPAIAARWSFNANVPGWVGMIRNSGSKDLVNLTVGRFRQGTPQFDLMVSSSNDGRPHVLQLAGAALTTLHAAPYLTQQTHEPHLFDIDGDGLDEVLSNGVIDFNGRTLSDGTFDPLGVTWQMCRYYPTSPQPWHCTSSWHAWDHADNLQPVGDLDGDGVADLLICDDGFNKVAPGYPGGSSVTWNGLQTRVGTMAGLLFHNTSAANEHGQTLALGRFLAGADAFGQRSPQAVFTPKNSTFGNGMSGNYWGSLTSNRRVNALAGSVSVNPWGGSLTGPVGWTPHAMDWDGDRASDECFSPFGNVNAVFRLTNTASGGYPHSWQSLHEARLWSRPYDSNGFMGTACDFFGDSREEWLAFSQNDVIFIDNPATYANAGKHPTPWRNVEYRRRYNSPVGRWVDFQAMPSLVRVEVRPAGVGLAVGGSRTLQAIGHYSDGSTEDVTRYATWSTGAASVATLSGNVVTAVANGTAALRATVAGIASNSPALVSVSSSTRPRVLYAGWADSYMVAGQPSTLRVEACVADSQNDMLALSLFAGSAHISSAFVDNGTNGDRVAADGIWTLSLPNTNFGASGDAYFQVLAVDMALNISDPWPYLTVPGSSPVTPVPGFPAFPFASESFGTPIPRVRGVGLLEATIAAGGGPITFGARVEDPRVSTIFLYYGGVDLGANLNDSGVGADQLAGDGLWTSAFTVPMGVLAPGQHVFDFVAFAPAPGGPFSDAHPRLRVH